MEDKLQQKTLLYSWRFFRYSTPIHWLVHGHMASNNETVSRRMPWAGNIAKTMTSNGKQFTVTLEMLIAVALDRWNLIAVFKFCFCFVLLYNKSLNDWSLGEQWILFPSNLNDSLDSTRETLRFSGKEVHCSPRDQSLRAPPRKYQLDLEIAKKSNFSKLAQNKALRALVTKILFEVC